MKEIALFLLLVCASAAAEEPSFQETTGRFVSLKRPLEYSERVRVTSVNPSFSLKDHRASLSITLKGDIGRLGRATAWIRKPELAPVSREKFLEDSGREDCLKAQQAIVEGVSLADHHSIHVTVIIVHGRDYAFDGKKFRSKKTRLFAFEPEKPSPLVAGVLVQAYRYEPEESGKVPICVTWNDKQVRDGVSSGLIWH